MVSPVKTVPGWFGSENQGAGLALADISGNGQPDLVVVSIDNPGGENRAYYRIGWNLDGNATAIGAWSQVFPIDGWIGAETQGAGAALADITRNGVLDLAVLTIDNPNGENRAYYRIGRNLDPAGRVTGGWTQPIAVPGWFGSEDQGAGIAIADVNRNGQLDLIVFHLDNPGGENHGYYRVGWDVQANGQATGWSDVMAVPGWFGSENQGAGIAVGDLDGNGALDLVVFSVDNPAGDNSGYYRVGRNLNSEGRPAGGWSNIQRVPGWFGYETQGADIALGQIAGGSKLDLIVFHTDNPAGENQGYYRMQKDIA